MKILSIYPSALSLCLDFQISLEQMTPFHLCFPNIPCLKAQVSLLPSKFLQNQRGDPLPGLRNLCLLAFMYFKELMYFGWKCGNVFFLLPPPELTLRLVISKGRMRAGNWRQMVWDPQLDLASPNPPTQMKRSPNFISNLRRSPQIQQNSNLSVWRLA